MRVPAVCNNCGTFFPSAFEFTNSTNISFSNVGSGPCPVCGGEGHIPDGLYNFIGNTIELLSGPLLTVSELERLAAILRSARQKKATYKDVTREVEKQLPELSSINDILPRTRTELYAFIAIIISAIMLIIGQFQSKEPRKIEINNVINNLYQQQSVSPEVNSRTVPSPHRKKIGRNELCPCGSGKKYKKCCLNKP